MSRKSKAVTAVSTVISMLVLTACGSVNLSGMSRELDNRIDERIEAALSGETAEEEAPEAYEIEEKELPLYTSNDPAEMTLKVAFINNVTDVPYINIKDAMDLLVMVNQARGASDYEITYEDKGEQLKLIRENGYPVLVDCKEDTIDFLDYDAFITSSTSPTLLDVVEDLGIDEEGNAAYFEHSDSSYERYGETVTIRPGDYGIDLVQADGKYYMPLQLFSDFFAQSLKVQVLYNGSALFWISGPETAAVSEVYYDVERPEKRSKELIDFNYNELCLMLDNFYGLKDQHDIKDFNTLFMETGLITGLMSEDPQEAGQAVADLTNLHLDDLHSGNGDRSWMMGNDVEKIKGPSILRYLADIERYREARNKYYPDGCPGYEEVGNTAYITFDGFDYTGVDYYKEKAQNDPEDTIGLMIYAYDMINRKDSPVENVVLDLSNNGGGAATSAAYVIGMFLGDASISVKDTMTGALVTQNYRIDANLDRKFDEKDSLSGHNLFCLISPKSFSCGNLVPSVLKNSHTVTMIGQTSGGGSCAVLAASTADGNTFQISGPLCMSYMKNGSFYDIDQGVDPDFILANPDLYYDREHLTEYINTEILQKQ
ncbi:MAG: hypothetical protein J5910_08290 [Lachnospiraceae bacterium]|nr:hypothetical protein [Lachnospiraceae bacterium]